MIAPATYLMDGPLSELPRTQARKIGEMATDLFNQRSYADRGDAIRILRALDHPFLDVFILVDDAIYLAKQHAIALEMSQS